ncbi:hypothetical protein [uncultured Microbacterium sp.]|uniref:hypothetical protein n=1 Tax=uncultured Microbacterium sp. TaxID=191216 RepID=UPI0025F55AEC|nr:hypothetical protein [uncultured Microbacterium sp.]
MPNVLILGGRAPVALDLARRFAHAGWTARVADSAPCRISGSSVSVASVVRLASPRREPERFAADLEGAVRAHAIDLVLPTCEEVFHVARWRHRLPEHVSVLAEELGTLRRLHSKAEFPVLAAEHGLDVPETARVRTLREARAWAQGRGVVLKPEFSRFGVHVRRYASGIPQDAPELGEGGAWVVQELLTGDERCSYAVAHRGRVLAHAVYRPRWSMPGGASFYFAPARDDLIRAAVRRLVAGIGFTGQISLDWIRQADGRIRPLECNPRATSGLHLFGADDPLPAALAGELDGCIEPIDPPPRMIAPMMLTEGLREAVRTGRIAQWAADRRAAQDVLAVAGDRAPLRGGLHDLAGHARRARAARQSLREAATADIEWDGDEARPALSGAPSASVPGGPA